MRFITIARNQFDLVSLPMDRPVITVGRSTLCEAVLRVPNIKPFQYVLTWQGTGSFNPYQGDWLLVDLSHNKMDHWSTKEDVLSNLKSFTGTRIAGSKPFLLNDLKFSISEEEFLSPDFNSPVRRELLGSLQNHSDMAMTQAHSKRKRELEVITLDAHTDQLRHLSHLPFQSSSVRLPEHADFRVKWESTTVANVQVPAGNGAEMKINNEAQKLLTRKWVPVKIQDTLSVKIGDERFIFRLVPSQGHHIAARNLKYGTTFASIFLSCLILFFYANSLVSTSSVDLQPPPPARRIAEIELPAVELATQPPPPPVMKLVAVAKPPPPVAVPEVKPAPISQKSAPPLNLAPRVAKVSPPKARISKSTKSRMPTSAPTQSQPAQVPQENLFDALGDAGTESAVRVNADEILQQQSRDQSKKNDEIFPEADLESALYKRTIPKRKSLRDMASDITADRANEAFLGNDNLGKAPSGKRGLQKNLAAFAGGLSAGGGADVDLQQGMASGGLDRETVLAQLMKRRSEIKGCYDTALALNSKISGKVTFRWLISGSGKVSSVQLIKSQAQAPTLEDCVKAVLQSLKFPAAANDRPTTVDYPFIFKKK